MITHEDGWTEFEVDKPKEIFKFLAEENENEYEFEYRDSNNENWELGNYLISFLSCNPNYKFQLESQTYKFCRFRKKQPKQKRKMTVKELFDAGAIIYTEDDDIYILITIFNHGLNEIGNGYCILNCSSNKKFKWTADRKTWHSNEVEE